MRYSYYVRPAARYAVIAGIAALGLTLSACNGSSNALGPISSFGPGGNSAQVRFVNASPDAGPVQVFIDNQQQFCTNGATGSACAVNYGQMTAYNVKLNAGSHAIILKDGSGNQIAVPGFSGSVSVNAGSSYAIVLAGELHPSYTASPNLTVTTITEQPYSASPQINFNQASLYVQSLNGSSGVQFGYYNGPTPSSNALGTPAVFGTATNPQTLPAAAQNAPITFYAMSPTTGFTGTPSIADTTNCSTNSLPCSNTSGHLELYLIDGPAASTAPTGIPAGINPSAKATFIGVFDP
jgi:hypothetical protein